MAMKQVEPIDWDGLKESVANIYRAYVRRAEITEPLRFPMSGRGWKAVLIIEKKDMGEK